MTRCKICNKEIKTSEDYLNSNYCSVQCEIADYIIDQFSEEYQHDKEVLNAIENYKAKLRSSNIAVTTDARDTGNYIEKQYKEDMENNKSLNISTKFFEYDKVYEKLVKSGSLKYYKCNFCGNTYQNINNGVIDRFTVRKDTGYCYYGNCDEWDIVFKIFFDAFSDSKQHLIVLKNMKSLVEKNERIDIPDSMRFFQMMSDRGIEAGAIEKKVWNLAVDECKSTIPNCRMVRHSDNSLERGISKFLRWL